MFPSVGRALAQATNDAFACSECVQTPERPCVQYMSCKEGLAKVQAIAKFDTAALSVDLNVSMYACKFEHLPDVASVFLAGLSSPLRRSGRLLPHHTCSPFNSLHPAACRHLRDVLTDNLALLTQLHSY